MKCFGRFENSFKAIDLIKFSLIVNELQLDVSSNCRLPSLIYWNFKNVITGLFLVFKQEVDKITKVKEIICFWKVVSTKNYNYDPALLINLTDKSFILFSFFFIWILIKSAVMWNNRTHTFRSPINGYLVKREKVRGTLLTLPHSWIKCVAPQKIRRVSDICLSISWLSTQMITWEYTLSWKFSSYVKFGFSKVCLLSQQKISTISIKWTKMIFYNKRAVDLGLCP